MRPARNIRDTVATAVLEWANGKFPEYPNLPWKYSNYFHLQHWHTRTHTRQPQPKRFQSKRIAINFTAHTKRNVFSLWLSLEQIIKCVIKRSWDVGTRYLATEAPASLRWQEIYYYCLCLRMMSAKDLLASFEYSISIENLWLSQKKTQKKTLVRREVGGKESKDDMRK